MACMGWQSASSGMSIGIAGQKSQPELNSRDEVERCSEDRLKELRLEAFEQRHPALLAGTRSA
jgi:hypothetical protein